MSGVGEDDDDRRDTSLEGEEGEEGEENIGTMFNHRDEDEEENVEFVDEEEEEDEEEENVEVMEEELRVDDRKEENVGVVPGKQQQQQQLYLKEEVLFGEEETDDVDVDIDDEGDEPPQSSISVLEIDDPFSSASQSENSVFQTAAASSGTHLNTAGEDAASHGGSLSPPMGMPISTVLDTFFPPTEDTPTLAANEVADGASPAVQIETGAEVFEVATAAGVQCVPSKQDVPKQEIKQVDLMTPSTDADLASENEDQAAPFDHLKEPPPPSNIDDDKSPSSLIRKNSIQETNLNLATEMENALRNLSSKQQQAPSDAPELNQTEQLLNVARTSANPDDLTSDLGGASQELEEDMFAEKDTEPSRSSNHDRHLNAFAGLDALTSAIDIGNARDALVKLQPNLNNGGTDGGGEAAGGGSDSGGGIFEHQRQKTELELEMELYEVAERQEQARLLASIRSGDQPMPGDSNNDRKRASESAPNESRKKRGKKAISSDEPKEEEDVCFICFDGGELVLCDRRTCPKAYHLNCIGRDVAFFEKKGAWICGWHFCAICTKAANFQCYTCPTAYCASCLAQADFYGIRQRKGLCEECWPIVQMIENKETVNLAEGVEVDFTDQETYEGLFKEYWEDLKQRLSLTPEELDKDSKTGGSAAFLEAGSDGEDRTENDDYVTESGNERDEEEEQEEEEEDDLDAREVEKTRKKGRGKAKAQLAEGEEGDTDFGSDNDDDAMELGEEDADDQDDDGKPSIPPREFDGWASKELIEFVKYMDEDPKKPLSRFQVTKLLWSYIKSQKLQDPRKKTHIVCDDRLRTIFGKKTVGQFEMFKHLQSHFAPKGRGRAGRQIRDEQVGMEEDGTDPDDTAVEERLGRINVKDRRRKKKGEEDKFERPNLNEYAAVTPKNIGLIYLRRQLLEELLDDPEFDSKVCSTFVRIRVPGMISKSEMCYRLVQVVGTRLQAEHYKAGRKVTNYVLEILNLQKREDVTVDLVSNHEFSEEECQRLRQSMKYGFIKALTVGDIEDKAKALQEAKVNDWFETERQRLVNLRDRASEKGRKKELRECVEKLQELNSPAFRAAKLHARPEVTADPRMDPDYKSDDNDDKAKDAMSKVLDKVHLSSPGDKVSPVGILKGHNESSRDWESTKSKQSSWGDTHRSKEVDRLYDSSRSSDKLSYGRPSHNYGPESAKERGYEERERGWGTEQQNSVAGDAGWMGNGRNRPTPAQKWNEKVDLSINVDARSGRSDYRGITGMTTPVFDTKSDWQSRREAAPPAAPSLPVGFPVPSPNVSTQAAIDAAEKEKIWHYTDPTGMMQGPFTMEQLRKWNATGYFPEDLRIWRTNQPRDESILLTDGLVGRLQKEREPWGSTTRVGNPVVASIQEEIAQALTTSSTVPFNNNPALKSADGWRENGGASSWTDRGGSGDVGRSVSYGSQDVNPNNRIFAREAGSGPSASLRDTSIDMKWKPGPAGGAYDSYGRSIDNSFPARSGRADAAAKFDPANWSRSTSAGRPERDSWGSSPAPGSDSGGYSNFGVRGSLGRGSNYKDSSGKWNPAESSGRESSRSSSRDALRASRKEIICRFHAKGYCKRGDSCDYWHG